MFAFVTFVDKGCILNIFITFSFQVPAVAPGIRVLPLPALSGPHS